MFIGEKIGQLGNSYKLILPDVASVNKLTWVYMYMQRHVYLCICDFWMYLYFSSSIYSCLFLSLRANAISPSNNF